MCNTRIYIGIGFGKIGGFSISASDHGMSKWVGFFRMELMSTESVVE